MISVCLASFNGEKFLLDQINSILIQLSDIDELVICDDGSTDESIDIIKSFDDQRIRFFNGPGQGVIKNFNFALSLCNGDYIFLSDQDDLWSRNKIKYCISYLTNGYDLVVNNASIIDNTNNVISPSFFNVNRTRPGLIHNFLKNGYIGCCLSFKKALLKYICPIPESVGMHDIWIGNVAAVLGNVLFTDQCLTYYRRHSSNVTPSVGQSNFSLIQKLKWRIFLLLNLCIRTRFNQVNISDKL